MTTKALSKAKKITPSLACSIALESLESRGVLTDIYVVPAGYYKMGLTESLVVELTHASAADVAMLERCPSTLVVNDGWAEFRYIPRMWPRWTSNDPPSFSFVNWTRRSVGGPASMREFRAPTFKFSFSTSTGPSLWFQAAYGDGTSGFIHNKSLADLSWYVSDDRSYKSLAVTGMITRDREVVLYSAYAAGKQVDAKPEYLEKIKPWLDRVMAVML